MEGRQLAAFAERPRQSRQLASFTSVCPLNRDGRKFKEGASECLQQGKEVQALPLIVLNVLNVGNMPSRNHEHAERE